MGTVINKVSNMYRHMTKGRLMFPKLILVCVIACAPLSFLSRKKYYWIKINRAVCQVN